MKMTRRSFIKTSVAAATLATVYDGQSLNAEAAVKPFYGADKKVYMNCRMCAQNCPMVGNVRDGRLIRVDANPNTPYPAVCARGRAAPAALYDPNRIRGPLIADGEKGSGKFRSATWKEALDKVAEKMLQLREEDEAHTVAYFPRFNTAPGLDNAFFNLYGTDNIFNYGDSCFGSANQIGLGSVLGGGPVPRQGNASVMGDYENSKLAVLIGRNPAGGLVAFPWGAMFGRGRKNGLKTVIVDPRKPDGVGETDADWLPVIPGTDTALLMGLANEIFTNKYYDENFLRKHTNADMLINTETLQPVQFDLPFEEPDYLVWDEDTAQALYKSEATRPAILGEYDYNGTKVKTALQMLMDSCATYTAEEASKVCGIPAQQIKKLASDLNNAKPSCFLERGYRSTRYYNSLHERRMVSVINGLLGAYGAKGGLIYGRSVRMDNPFAWNENEYETVCSHYADNVKGFELADIWNLRRLFPRAVEDGIPYKLRMAFINGQNPVGGAAGGNFMAEALKKMEMVVAISPYWNESLLFADVILPDSTFMERDEPFFSEYKATFPVLTVHNKAVEPMFNVRNGYDIMLSLAKRIFDEDEYSEYFADFEKGGIEYIREYQLENIYGMNENDERSFSAKALIDNGVWCGTPSPVRPIAKRSPSGKIEVYSTFMAKWNKILKDDGREFEAQYYTPLFTYAPTYWQTLKNGAALAGDEFVPITGFHPLSSFTGAQTRNNVLLKNTIDALGLDNVFINAAKGKALGLATGDEIEIFNIEIPNLVEKATVTLTETVEPNALFCFYGIGNGIYAALAEKLDVASKSGFNPNHIANLTFSPVDASATSHDFIVKIRRAK